MAANNNDNKPKQPAKSSSMKEIPAKIMELAAPLAPPLGCEVIDVEWVREDGEWILRIYLDREDPVVDHELCESFSRKISDLLDEVDPIEENYLLEISSPGLERPLKSVRDYERFAGNLVRIKLFAPQMGVKRYEGRLLGITGNVVNLEVDGKKVDISRDKIAKANLMVEF